MLTLPQLQQVAGADPYLYEALKRIVGAVNSLGARLGVDPAPAPQATPGQTVPPPPAPASLSVTAARGIFSIALAPIPGGSAAPGRAALVNYFLEAAADPAFAQPAVYPLGGALAAHLSLGNVARYWRARAKYLESDYGPYVFFGTAAQPTPVLGGLATSADLAPNLAANFTNFATVDSLDAGSSVTVRIYGTAGPGSSWTRVTGQGSAVFPAGEIPGLAYSTLYYIVWDGAAYLALTSLTAALADPLVAVGKLTTVAPGGSGGTTGGGGSTGSKDGGPLLIL
jgi:hypothetical protein